MSDDNQNPKSPDQPAPAGGPVLFSLTNLQALTQAPKGAKAAPPQPVEEGSGLLDIRNLSQAIQTAKDAKEEKKESPRELLSFGGDASSAFSADVSKIMLPTQKRGMGTGLIVAASLVGVGAVGAIVFMLLFALGVVGPVEETETVVVAGQAPPPVAATDAPTTIPAPEDPVAPETPTASKTKTKTKPKPGAKETASKTETKTPAEKPSKKRNADELGDLLGGIK